MPEQVQSALGRGEESSGKTDREKTKGKNWRRKMRMRMTRIMYIWEVSV
jgi:hypothetical protein